MGIGGSVNAGTFASCLDSLVSRRIRRRIRSTLEACGSEPV
jgi:hypothetical protein